MPNCSKVISVSEQNTLQNTFQVSTVSEGNIMCHEWNSENRELIYICTVKYICDPCFSNRLIFCMLICNSDVNKHDLLTLIML